MLRDEIEYRIEQLENERFMIDMVDRWSDKERERMWEINRELDRLYRAARALD